MKNNIFIVFACALVLFISCDKNEFIKSPNSGEGFTLLGYSNEQTKTDFGAPGASSIPFIWSAGDKITVNGVESNPLTTGGERAEFTFSSGSVSVGDVVYYNRDTEGTWGFNVKNVQNGNIGESGDYGEGEIAEDGKSFTLTHKTSYLWLNPKAIVAIDSKVVRVDIESDGNIAGNGTSNYNNIMVNIPNDKELKIGKSDAEGIWLAVVIAPTTINKFSIIYYFADGTKAICNFNRELTFEPGKTIKISHTISDIIRTLTFENGSEGRDFLNQIGDSSYSTWSNLIDSPQYGGSLLYGPDGYGVSAAENPYNWYDKGNTELQHMISEGWGSYAYWSGGHAISHYNSSYIPDCGSSQYQLTVYNQNASASEQVHTTAGGNNGSNNFAVHTGYADDSGHGMGANSLPTLLFGDSNARVIDHMYVNNTTYVLNSLINGDGFASAAGDGDYLKIEAKGYGEDLETVTGAAEFYLCNGPANIISEWTKWDLSSLGSVAMITFNVVGSITDGYGLATPAYFAYDDVAVRFPLTLE